METSQQRGVTPRVVVLCLLLAVLFGYIDPIIDVKLSNTFLGAAHLPPGAIAVLLVLLLVINPLVRLAARRNAFSRNETLTVYITCLFSALVPGHGAENFFVPNLIGPFYYATRENKWLDYLNQYLPKWFSPALQAGPYDRLGGAGHDAVASWYTGLTHGQAIPWGIWLVPLVAWSALVLASYCMLACLSVMLRAQWAEREALAFPLLRLPMELTEDLDRQDSYGVIGRFFRNPTMWVGFGLAVLYHLFNGLHRYFPDVPQINADIPLNSYFTEPPWNQVGTNGIFLYPIVVGITYLLTSETSFSLWFFYWLIRFELIFAYYIGYPAGTLPNAIGSTGGAKTFTGYQQIGAYIAYVGIVLWTGREHLWHIVRRAFAREKAGEGEKSEAMSYPMAFWGFLLSFIFVVGWSTLAGMRADVAFMLWLAYLIIAIALTRVVAEGGLLFVQQGWAPLGAASQIVNSGPGTWLTPSTIVPGTFLQASLMTDLRAFLMPSFVQSFKLAHDRKIAAKPLLALITVTTIITLAMSLWMNVRLGYTDGGLQLNGWFAIDGAKQPALNADKLMKGVHDATWFNMVWLGFGTAATYAMMALRSRFLWFPLHPIGYLMCLTYPMNRLWFSIFLGWLLKVIISRFGGSEHYRRLMPGFLGLALGDVTMMLLWLVIDGWQAMPRHQLMPG